MDRLLSANWAGLLPAVLACVIGGGLSWWGWRARRAGRRGSGPVLALVAGLPAILLGVTLAAGATRHLLRVAAAARRFPPPGRLVDVGGYRLHLWCEGPTAAGPTVVWIPGGHGQGIGLKTLHDRIKADTRSCLYDRAGAGWSEPGVFPKTVAVEVEELDRTLRNAGEGAPFLFVGHSAGGMLAVNVAARHPDRTAALFLIDPAMPDFYAYGAGSICPQFLASTRRSAWRALFGLEWAEVRGGEDPVSRALAPVLATMAATDAQPRYFRTAHSAYQSMCRNPLQLAAGDGVLGDIPLMVLAPPEEDVSLELLAEAFRGRIADDEVGRLRAVLRAGREQAARLSRGGELIRGPAGTTHQLPYEAPDFVLARLRDLQIRLRAR